jgi:hypothetical protein
MLPGRKVNDGNHTGRRASLREATPENEFTTPYNLHPQWNSVLSISSLSLPFKKSLSHHSLRCSEYSQISLSHPQNIYQQINKSDFTVRITLTSLICIR